MAKEFKEFDKIHRSGSDSDLSAEELALAKEVTRWPHEVGSWSIQQVREATYVNEGFGEWQKFRVSMKGQSTCVKLFRLLQRWSLRVDKFMDTNERIRIDNYINALKRGGQIGDNYEVRR